MIVTLVPPYRYNHFNWIRFSEQLSMKPFHLPICRLLSFTYLSLTQLSEWISICFMNAVKTSQIMIDYIGWDISKKIQCFQYKCKQIKILSGFSMTTMATYETDLNEFLSGFIHIRTYKMNEKRHYFLLIYLTLLPLE